MINLIKEGEILEKLIINENDNKIGCLDRTKLEKTLDVFRILGLTKEKLDLDSFIYKDNHHKKIVYELDYQQRNLLIMLIIFMTIIFILIILI